MDGGRHPFWVFSEVETTKPGERASWAHQEPVDGVLLGEIAFALAGDATDVGKGRGGMPQKLETFARANAKPLIGVDARPWARGATSPPRLDAGLLLLQSGTIKNKPPVLARKLCVMRCALASAFWFSFSINWSASRSSSLTPPYSWQGTGQLFVWV